ncbi:MAG: hypothetical protein ACREEL_03780 [Stellaceae bacterium]
MWNEITSMAGHSGAMGPTLGVLWLLGLAVAAFARLTLQKHRR